MMAQAGARGSVWTKGFNAAIYLGAMASRHTERMRSQALKMQSGAEKMKKPNKNNGTMKDLINIIVAREEGFTSREWKMGGVFVAGMVVVCILAEIINAL